IGNAKLPVALLNSAKGAYTAGGFRHPPTLPVEAACREEKSIGTRINPAAASAAASAHPRRAFAWSGRHRARASAFTSHKPSVAGTSNAAKFEAIAIAVRTAT